MLPIGSLAERKLAADAASNIDVNPVIEQASPPGASLDNAALLPPRAAVAIDVGAAMAEMLVTASFSRRQSDRAVKDQAESALAHEQSDELKSMREAADDKLTASRWQAGSQIAAGMVSIGSSLAGGVDNQTVSVIGKALSSNGGASDALKGTGGWISAGYKHDADLEDIQTKASENVQTQLKSQIEDAKTDIQETRNLVDKSLDFLKEYEQTRAQTMMASIQRT